MRKSDFYGLKEERAAHVNVPGRRERHGAPFNPSHGPPLNSNHGPPSLSLQYTGMPYGNLYSKPPRRPSRPPSLDTLSQPMNLSRSQSRVKFAIDPPDRPATYHRTRQGVHDSTTDPASGASHGDVMPHPIHRKIPKRPATAPGGISGPIYQTGQKVTEEGSSFDISELSEHHDFPHLTSSTSRPPSAFSEDGKQVATNSGPSTDDPRTKSLQPSSLLVRRRRSRPLAILPAATAHLSPSSLQSSIDSPPPATPTSSILAEFSMASNQGHNGGSKSHGRFRDIGPPVHSPPATPLPSPPGIFNEAARSPTFNNRKTLRVARSTSSSRRSIPEVRKTQSHPDFHTSLTSPFLVS